MMGDHYTFGQMAKSSIYLVGFAPHFIHEKILSAVSIEGNEDVKKQLQSGYDDLQYKKCQLPFCKRLFTVLNFHLLLIEEKKNHVVHCQLLIRVGLQHKSCQSDPWDCS